MAAFLDSIANGTTSIEQAEDIETLAQQRSARTRSPARAGEASLADHRPGYAAATAVH